MPLKHFIRLSSLLVLVGCANEPIVVIPDAMMELSAHPLQDRRAAAEQRSPDEIQKATQAAQWLKQPLQAVYRQLPANIALQQVALGWPIRFDFDFKTAPKVSSSANALSIGEHLQSICRQANWAYALVDGVLVIRDIETQTFYLASQPGESRATLKLRNLDEDGGSGSDGPTNSVQVGFDPFQREIKPLLETVLGLRQDSSVAPPLAPPPRLGRVIGFGQNPPTAGAASPQQLTVRPPYIDPRTRFAILPSANAVVVTAAPQLMREVELVLGEYIQASAKVVLVSITFFEVDISENEERSLNLNFMRKGAQVFGLSLNPPDVAPSSGNFSVSFANGRVATSSAVLNWLQTMGETQIAFEDSVEVRNNAIASLDATRTRQYVSGITRENQLAGNTTLQTPQIEFDQLRVGWSIHLQPTVVNDLITLRLHLSRSDYVNELPFSFDEGRIAGTNFVTEEYHRAMAVTLVDGETRLLTALASQSAHTTNSRTPWLPLIGDKHSSTGSERQTVMMLTATLL